MTDRICSIEGCGKPHQARGWCKKHWTRWNRHGDPLGKAIRKGAAVNGFKKCPKCRQTLPISDFGKNRSTNSGRHHQCRLCHASSAAIYRQENPEKWAAIQRAYRQENAEKVAATKRAYRQENAEKEAASHQAWNRANVERKRWHDRRRDARKKGNGVHTILEKELKVLYASPCVACGTTENIQRDHVIPIARGGQDSIGNSQPLCGPCNFSKKDKLMIEWRVWRDKLAGPSVGAA